jgi:hypothetical protein
LLSFFLRNKLSKHKPTGTNKNAKIKSNPQMRRAIGATALVLAVTFVLSAPAKASELWNPYVRGVNEGMAARATPPPGVYGVLDCIDI